MTKSQQLLSSLGRSTRNLSTRTQGQETQYRDLVSGPSPQRNSLGFKHLPNPYSQDQPLSAVLTRKLDSPDKSTVGDKERR